MVAVYKSGMGTRGRVCGDLWTRDEGLGDIKYGTWGCVGQGCGDAKYRDEGNLISRVIILFFCFFASLARCRGHRM